MRRIAKLLPYLAILLVLAIAGVFFLRSGPFAARLGEAVTQELQQRTGREVAIGSVTVVGPGLVRLRDVSIAGRGESPLLTAPEITVRTGRGGLWQRLTTLSEVQEITLRRPTLRVTRRSTGLWDISDLFARAKGKTKFTGKVAVEEGEVVFTDQAREGRVTTLTGVNLSTISEASGKTRFTLRAAEPKGAFKRLEVTGDYDSATSAGTLTLAVADLDAAYAYQRLPKTKSFALTAGRGEVSGKVTLGRNAGPLGFSPDLEAKAHDVSISFPWLRRPLVGMRGTVRLKGERVIIAKAKGAVEGAPVTLQGTIAGFARPQLDLDFSVSDLAQPQIKALFPTLALPPTLALTAPINLKARAQGAAPELVLRGQASTKEVRLNCVPWHDFVTDFSYSRGQLLLRGMRAHGSPRRLEGDLEVRFRPGGVVETQASLVMREVPLKMLLGCAPELAGLELSGLVTLNLQTSREPGGAMTGSFTAREVRYQRYALGTLTGEFSWQGETLQLTQGNMAGPTATGRFALTATRGGRYELTTQLSSLELGALGLKSLTGAMQGEVNLKGSLRAGGAGRVELTAVGPGPVRALSADLLVAPRRVALRNLALQPAQGRVTGELAVSEGNRLSGRLEISEASTQEWLPGQYRALVPVGPASGVIELGGRLEEPALRADLSVARVSLPALGEGTARLRARAAQGTITVEEFTFESQGKRLTLQGEYSPRRGLDFRLPEAQTDLSVISSLLSLWTGRSAPVALSGLATVSASVRGQPHRPEVSFRVTAPSATLNAQPVRGLEVVGALRDGVLSLETARLAQNGGHLILTGTVELATQRVNLHLTAAEIDLAAFSFWTRPRLGLDLTGSVTAEATLTGPPQRRQGSFRLLSPAATINELSITGLEFSGRLFEEVLTLDTLSFQQGRSSLKANGTVNLRNRQLDLSLGLNAMDISSLMLVFARAASRLAYFGTTEALLRAYIAIPGPLGGSLTAGITLKGSYDNPQIAADLSLEQLSFASGVVDSISGSVETELREGRPRRVTLALVATQEEAIAEIAGSLAPEGETQLRIEVNNLDLQVLVPWFKSLAGVRGRATASFDVTGRTDDPLVLGGVFIDAPGYGPFGYEAIAAYPIRLQGGVLTIEDLRLRNGPMQGTGSATLPLRLAFRPLRVTLLSAATADLEITGGRYSPIAGMSPAQYDADLHLVGRRILVQKSADESSPEFRLPGVRGRIGAGTFSIGGEVILPDSLTEIALATYDLTLDLTAVELVIPEFITAKLGGRLLLVNSENGGPLLRTAEGAPLVVSQGKIGVPPATTGLVSATAPPFAPELQIRVVAGEGLSFEYKPVQAEIQPGPGTYVEIGGRLTAAEVRVGGEVRSGKAELSFPNARLDLISGVARIDRNPNQPLRVRVVEAEAVGTVGEYQVTLNPTGQVYPAACYDPECVPLDLRIRTTPYLEPAYALALLVGPIVAPAVSSGLDSSSVLTAAHRPPVPGAALAGITLPYLGTYNVALDYTFEGPLTVRLRQRLFGRFFVQFSSPLAGQATTRRVAITYQVTPRYSIGFSQDALGNTRYQAQSYWPF